MFAVIRVRGEIKVIGDIKDTMAKLRLHRPNHLVVINESDSIKGMLQKAKDYITWGEIDEKIFAKVLEKRGKLEGDKSLDKKFLDEKKFGNYEELAKTILTGGKRLSDVGIKPVFRLRPPRKGYERKGIKKPFSVGGALGNRGNEINALIESMI